MSNFLHKSVKTFGWRFRRLNGAAVYAVDHNKDSLREFAAKPNPTIGEIDDLLVEDFCKRVSAVSTPVSQWIDNNPMMPYYLRTFKVECDKLKNDPDKNSVRNAKIPLGAKLKIVGSADRLSELTFNVLVLSQRLADVRSNESFTEYTILGVLPWHRIGDVATVNNEMFVPIESIILNSELSTLAKDSLAALKDCRFPKIRILPFGDDGVYKRRAKSDDDDNNSEEEEEEEEIGDDQPTTEQLLSFCIRWHVARKGKAASFFEKVIGSAQQGDARELDDQLFGLTVKYFKESPASEKLFSNRKFFSTIVALWNKNIMPLHNRVWMQRQFADAIDYLVLENVIALGSAARLLFVKDVVVSAIEYFMPQIVVIRPVVRDFLVIDFFSLGRCSMKLNVCELVRKFDANILDSEQPFKIVKGHVYIPISSACRLFGSIMRAAMSRVLNHPDLEAKRQENDEWLIDDTVMPLRNTDLYVARRTVRYDDFPVDGKVSKTIGVSVSSTSQRVGEAVAAYNLPAAFGLADNNISDDYIVDPNASIPLRNSSAVVRVSQSSLNDMCSVSMPDIEDLGNSLQQNPCMSLHNNNALPLCARSRTSVLVNTSNEYLLWDDRWFLHKFFMSLDLPYVTHEAILEFMLKNSTTTQLHKKHSEEINRFPKQHEKYVRKTIANKAAGSDSNVEPDEYSVSAGATYMGKCISNYTKGCCPFTKMADGEIDADAKFKQLLVKMQHPLAGENDAVQRIIDATKRTKNINAGCMQEYVETRNLINKQVVPKAHPDLRFDRPKHYVLACAEYKDRTDR